MTFLVDGDGRQRKISELKTQCRSKTTNARTARFLTTTTVVEFCGVNHRGALASLSRFYVDK